MKGRCEHQNATVESPDVMARTLFQAIQNGEEKLAKDIIQCGSYGADKQPSKAMNQAFFFCCCRGYVDVAKLLLDKGANVKFTGKNSATALHAAVDNEHLNVVRLLITHGAKVNAQTSRGDTPLHLAAYRGSLKIAQCLIQAGAVCSIVNSNSLMAENEAIGRGYRDLGGYLRSERCAQYPGVVEEDGQSLDSVIQLDPPSISDAPSLLNNQHEDPPSISNTPRLLNNQHEADKEKLSRCRNHIHHNIGLQMEGKKSSATNDNNPEPCKNDISEFDNLSFISLDPPVDAFSHVAQHSHISQAHSRIINPPFNLQRTTSKPQLPENNCSVLSSLRHPVFPIAGYRFTDGSSNKSSEQIHSPSSGYTDDIRRRPSIGSNCSSISEFSRSDSGSLLSSGSDGSGSFSDVRSWDEEQAQDRVSYCLNKWDKDILFQSLGVRNPPVQNYRRFPRMSDSEEFSDIYDSSLFSFSSVTSESSPFSDSGPSSDNTEYNTSERVPKYSSLDSCEITPRPLVARALSDTCPSNNMKLKARPDKNNTSRRLRREVSRDEICSNSSSSSSNDLSSSSFSLTDKTASSLTYINIPLK